MSSSLILLANTLCNKTELKELDQELDTWLWNSPCCRLHLNVRAFTGEYAYNYLVFINSIPSRVFWYVVESFSSSTHAMFPIPLAARLCSLLVAFPIIIFWALHSCLEKHIVAKYSQKVSGVTDFLKLWNSHQLTFTNEKCWHASDITG